MASEFTISLAAVIKEEGFETLYMPVNPEEVLIASSDLSRPGLELRVFSIITIIRALWCWAGRRWRF